MFEKSFETGRNFAMDGSSKVLVKLIFFHLWGHGHSQVNHYGPDKAHFIQITLQICQWTLQFLIFLTTKVTLLVFKSLYQTLLIIYMKFT